MHGVVPSLSDILVRSNINRTRGHSHKLAVIRSTTEARKRFFTNRVVTAWNNLPEIVVSSGSLNTFKSRLHTHLGDLLYYYHE